MWQQPPSTGPWHDSTLVAPLEKKVVLVLCVIVIVIVIIIIIVIVIIFRSHSGSKSPGAPGPWHLDRGTSLVQTQRPWTVASALSERLSPFGAMSTPTTPQPHLMMGPPMCSPMALMSMFPQKMGAQPACEDGGQAYARVPGFRNGMEKKVTTSGIPLYKLPKVRLG